MATLGSAEESLRLAEHYRRLTDEELIALAQQRDKLTELAQQALAMEIGSRKLTLPLAQPQSSRRPVRPPDSGEEEDSHTEQPADEDGPYAEDRKLVEVSRVWSEADARRLEYVLHVAGIPFYMGREKATSVDSVTSKFDRGLPVKVMQIGLPWAYEAMRRNYVPHDEPPEPQFEDARDIAIHCPRCRSTEVVFNERADRVPGALPKYRWTCGSCGYEWEDDGVVTGD